MAISSFLATKSALAPNYAIGNDGWTRFYPSPDSRIIYVSTTDGNNSNDGLSASTPKLTVYGAGGAASLVRDWYPDWVLFKRGDTFQNGWSTIGVPNCSVHGRSRFQPMLLGAYGPNSSSSNPMGDPTGARPKIVPALGLNSGESLITSSIQSFPGSVVYTGLEFYDYRANPNDPNTGIVSFRGDITAGNPAVISNVTNFNNITVGMKIMGPGTRGLTIASFDSVAQTITLSGSTTVTATNLFFQAGFSVLSSLTHTGHLGLVYIEDCFFNHSSLTLNMGSGPTQAWVSDATNTTRDTQVILRRNVFTRGIVPMTSNGTCIFMGDFANHRYPSIVEENVMIYGGWNPDVLGSEGSALTHVAYCHDAHSVQVYAGNIVGEGATNGYMQRDGTKAYNNMYFRNNYGGTMGSGVTANPFTVSHNCYVQGGGNFTVELVATANSPAGSTTITVDRLVSTPAGSYATQLPVGPTAVGFLINVDNPGSLPNTGATGGRTNASSIASDCKTITLGNQNSGSQTVAAGTRGDGVKIGDRIRISPGANVSNGYNVGASYGFHLVGPPSAGNGNYTYPSGITGPWYLPYDRPLPADVQTGWKVFTADNVPWGLGVPGTLATISSDRRSFTTVETSINPLLAGNGHEFLGGNYGTNRVGYQSLAVFYDPANVASSVAAIGYPAIRVGPNNIFANNEGYTDNGAAIANKATTMNSDASGNYIYKWIQWGALSLNLQNNNPLSTNVGWDTASQTFCSNNGSGLPGNPDNATIEGYMSSLGLTPTKTAFYDACLAQRKGSWDTRFTSNAFNNYVRGLFGVSPLTITYPAYNYNTAS